MTSKSAIMSLQELIFSVEGFKPFGWYLTLVQFGFYSMFGLVELQLTQDKRRRYIITSDQITLVGLRSSSQLAINTSSALYLSIFQDTWEDLYDNSLSDSGHYGPVQYLSGLLELPDTGHLQVL